MHLECGKSLWAKRRRQRAAELGLKFQAGSDDAARRLLYRRFGLMGIAKYGPMYRIPFMLAGAKRARERRKQQQEQQQRVTQRKQQLEREALYLKMVAWAAEALPPSIMAARKRMVLEMEKAGKIQCPDKAVR